jgi:hypothetical protein
VAEAYNSLGSVSFYSEDYANATAQLAESAARFKALKEEAGAKNPLVNSLFISNFRVSPATPRRDSMG